MHTIKFKNLNLSNDEILLDMGCGEGRHSIGAFIDTQVNILGLDLSIKDLNIAKDRLNDFDTSGIEAVCQFGAADIVALPLADSTLDAVICSEVLEHVDSPQESIEELIRVLKPGGVMALSVPRFMPELLCWKLSREYSKTPGGHVRIFKFKELKKDITNVGLTFTQRHWAHALHSPYWWLKCLLWKSKESSKIINLYHDFLVWDMMKKPLLTKILEFIFQPLIGKSVVLYFNKDKA